jgi:hypothetical protein
MINLMMDSGAFSSFTQGKVIDLSAYCTFLKQNEKYIYKSVTLDVINPKDPNVAALAGMKNYLEMRTEGLDPIPVYHARESRKWLDEYLDITDYVGISTTSLVSPVEARVWSRICWNYITDGEGLPIVKTHCFGDVSEYTLLTQPHTSVDAATWMIMGGRAGRIKLSGKSYQIHTKKIGDPNFISIHDTGPKRESWEMEIRELGLDPTFLINLKPGIRTRGSGMAMLRSFLVAADLLRLQEQTRFATRFNNPHTLLTTKRQMAGGQDRGGPVRMFFVLSPSAYQFNFPVLAALKIPDILVSYYYVITAQKNFWEECMIPFLEGPAAFCERDEKIKPFWELLQSCLLKQVSAYA